MDTGILIFSVTDILMKKLCLLICQIRDVNLVGRNLMNNVTSILRKMGQILEIFANGLKNLKRL